MEPQPESGFRSCSSGHTKCVGSIYPKNQVPNEMFEKPNGGYYATCLDCRKHSAARKNKLKNKIDENQPGSGFRSCTHLHTKCVASIHPRNKVPDELFEKSNGEHYTSCLDCRKYYAIQNNRYENKKKENDNIKKELVEKESDRKFSICPYNGHSNVVKSPYPKDLVPITLFRMEPNNPKSELYVNCLDCREYIKEKKHIWIDNVKSLAEDNGLYVCGICCKTIDHEDRAINLDGTLSTVCTRCKRDRKKLFIKNKQNYVNTKLEFIENFQCSCYKCKFLFLNPMDDSLIVRKIPTYEKDESGNRYGLIDGKEMSLKDIIKDYHDELEVGIIDLDHLPEKEQRERGLLLSDEIYVPKKKNVSAICGKASVKLESLKCQHLCILCHTKETMEREKGESTKTGFIKIKYDYVSKCKEKGCSSCGFTDPNPKFFDMDHLDISDKKANVSKMCIRPEYSLDDVIKECEKCRVLCKHCHRIRTNKQMEQGLFLPKSKEIKK